MMGGLVGADKKASVTQINTCRKAYLNAQKQKTTSGVTAGSQGQETEAPIYTQFPKLDN